VEKAKRENGGRFEHCVSPSLEATAR